MGTAPQTEKKRGLSAFGDLLLSILGHLLLSILGDLLLSILGDLLLSILGHLLLSILGDLLLSILGEHPALCFLLTRRYTAIVNHCGAVPQAQCFGSNNCFCPHCPGHGGVGYQWLANGTLAPAIRALL
jgi:hypothetical protein